MDDYISKPMRSRELMELLTTWDPAAAQVTGRRRALADPDAHTSARTV